MGRTLWSSLSEYPSVGVVSNISDNDRGFGRITLRIVVERNSGSYFGSVPRARSAGCVCCWSCVAGLTEPAWTHQPVLTSSHCPTGSDDLVPINQPRSTHLQKRGLLAPTELNFTNMRNPLVPSWHWIPFRRFPRGTCHLARPSVAEDDRS